MPPRASGIPGAPFKRNQIRPLFFFQAPPTAQGNPGTFKVCLPASDNSPPWFQGSAGVHFKQPLAPAAMVVREAWAPFITELVTDAFNERTPCASWPARGEESSKAERTGPIEAKGNPDHPLRGPYRQPPRPPSPSA